MHFGTASAACVLNAALDLYLPEAISFCVCVCVSLCFCFHVTHAFTHQRSPSTLTRTHTQVYTHAHTSSLSSSSTSLPTPPNSNIKTTAAGYLLESVAAKVARRAAALRRGLLATLGGVAVAPALTVSNTKLCLQTH